MDKLSGEIVRNLKVRMAAFYPQYSTSVFSIGDNQKFYINVTKEMSHSRPMLHAPQYEHPEYWLHSFSNGQSSSLIVAGHILYGLINHNDGSTIVMNNLVLKLLTSKNYHY
mgnify:FL=1